MIEYVTVVNTPECPATNVTTGVCNSRNPGIGHRPDSPALAVTLITEPCAVACRGRPSVDGPVVRSVLVNTYRIKDGAAGEARPVVGYDSTVGADVWYCGGFRETCGWARGRVGKPCLKNPGETSSGG